MWKTAGVVLAASLLLSLPVSRAAPSDEEPAAATALRRETAGGPTVKLFGPRLPESLRLPEELESLSPEQRRDVLDTFYRHWVSTRPAPREWPGGICLAGADADLCAAATRIAHRRPCLAAGDCPALEEWKEVMGTPGLRPAPRSMVRAADRSRSEPPEQD